MGILFSFFLGFIFQTIRYNLGSNFLAPRIIHVHKTKGMVRTGSPKGNSHVWRLAAMGTVKQPAIIPMISPCRSFSLNTRETAMIVRIALKP